MSAPSNIDFVKGYDFTSEPEAAFGDLHALVESAYPYTEANPLEGKGLVIATLDTALDTPSVPATASVPKWKRYIWMRIPHSTATDTKPLLYVWDENATSDATYLKWVLVIDVVALEADIDALELSVINLSTTVGGMNAQINVLNNRVTDAEAAAEAATEAATEQIPALTARVTAVENVNATQTTNITAAQTTADQALAAANDVTADQLNDTLDLSAKDVTLNPLTSGNLQLHATELTVIAGKQTIAHGLGQKPTRIRWVIRCVATDGDFTEGEEYDVSSILQFDGGSTIGGPICGADDTNLIIRAFSSANIQMLNNAGAVTNMTEANWRYRCYYGL
jgi:hypothetical protein